MHVNARAIGHWCFKITAFVLQLLSIGSSLVFAYVIYLVAKYPSVAAWLWDDFRFAWFALFYLFLQWARISTRSVFNKWEFLTDLLSSVVPVVGGALLMYGDMFEHAFNPEMRSEVVFLGATGLIDLVCGSLQAISMLQAPFKRDESKASAH